MVQVPGEESTTLGVDTAATVTLMAVRKSTHQYCLYCTQKGPFPLTNSVIWPWAAELSSSPKTKQKDWAPRSASEVIGNLKGNFILSKSWGTKDTSTGGVATWGFWWCLKKLGALNCPPKDPDYNRDLSKYQTIQMADWRARTYHLYFNCTHKSNVITHQIFSETEADSQIYL